MRAVLFMLRNVFTESCCRCVFSLIALVCLMGGSNANSMNVGGTLCGPEVTDRGGAIIQGGEELAFRSPAWQRLFGAIQRAGVVNPEIDFLPVSAETLETFEMSPTRFQALRNKLHTTVGGALYDLVLSTTARHVGMRMGEFLPGGGPQYDSRAAHVFYATFATAPSFEKPGSSAWWGNELFGVFPSFRFLVDKCITPIGNRGNVDPEVCMAHEVLSSFGKLVPLLEGKSFESVFVEDLARHGGTCTEIPGKLQFVLTETFLKNGYPAVAYRVLEQTRVKAQMPGDVVLPFPVRYVSPDALRNLAGILISRTAINDSTDEGGSGTRQIGVSLSLGATEGMKLRVLLTKLRGALHPSGSSVVLSSAIAPR